MKKIMFSDKYRLTEAVLEGRKTQTRRLVPTDLYNQTDWKAVEEGDFKSVVDGEGYYHDIRDCGNYRIGEVVAIAQRYSDIEDMPFDRNFDVKREGKERAGWTNKMFVEAIYMPHHIRITNVRLERLQDINDEDCIAEGIYKRDDVLDGRLNELVAYTFNNHARNYLTPKEAYAALADKISGKGTWNTNPFVFVYCFELIN